ncbi:MAG: phosphoribosylformylglycinamidine synthase subunit PurQ [Archaeoglobaceae archaeon]|nr:phosphoribosylformylglycinamidine synthase subunit PurQ [Archaeoglobaceae archaeon]MCX8151823.1 phosphoribosylformylglycinamidine synthase subunit PurQ [Archaeoglobaceae archaeon]MDW8014345.1 phosphoribosylformylglycinamidine synthase subunit PurQ [Archaeoglobaceae archaeon]
MDLSEIRVAVLRIEGTNCEDETVEAFKNLGVFAEAVHLKQFYSDMIRLEDQRSIFDYHCIVFPGGFSAGDYVRAGAIFSARFKSVLRKDLEEFIKMEYPVLGICNGFQILAELGALPGLDEDKPIADKPEMALTVNESNRFECRPSLLKKESSRCIFTKKVPEIVMFPVAHAEGKVVFPKDREKEILEKLVENDQIVFRYIDDKGNYAGYPWNPNGSFYNIAGLCNSTYNVFGLMPHPERVFYDYVNDKFGDGYYLFKSIVEYLESW